MKKKRKINFKRIFLLLAMGVIAFVSIKLYFSERVYDKEGVFPEEVYGVKVNTEIIKYLVIHETDNTAIGSTAKNHSEFLSKNNKTSTSWHYTVDDKEIYHHIPDNEIAHHAATQDGNQYGVGIELCVNEDGNFEKTFDNGAKLVAYLLKEYDLPIKSIKTHHDFSGKDCPHNILKDDRMKEFTNKVKEYMKQ